MKIHETLVAVLFVLSSSAFAQGPGGGGPPPLGPVVTGSLSTSGYINLNPVPPSDYVVGDICTAWASAYCEVDSLEMNNYKFTITAEIYGVNFTPGGGEIITFLGHAGATDELSTSPTLIGPGAYTILSKTSVNSNAAVATYDAYRADATLYAQEYHVGTNQLIGPEILVKVGSPVEFFLQ